MGVGGAVGGFTGALIGMGIPEFEAKRYEGRIAKGGILLSVHCDTSDEIKRAKDIMKGMGAEDISSTGESSSKSSDVPPVGRAAGTGSQRSKAGEAASAASLVHDQKKNFSRRMHMSRNRWPETISAFVIGIGVGAALGVLFAPQSGEDTRDYLIGTAKDGLDQAVDTARDGVDQISARLAVSGLAARSRLRKTCARTCKTPRIRPKKPIEQAKNS